MRGKRERERERAGMDLVARQANWQGRDLQRKGKLNGRAEGLGAEMVQTGEPESRGGGAVEEAESVKPFLSLRPFAAFAPLR